MDRHDVEPVWLDSIISVLKKHDVAMAKIGDVEIVFNNSIPDDAETEEAGTEVGNHPRSVYKNPNLFQDGRVPGFTKVE